MTAVATRQGHHENSSQHDQAVQRQAVESVVVEREESTKTKAGQMAAWGFEIVLHQKHHIFVWGFSPIRFVVVGLVKDWLADQLTESKAWRTKALSKEQELISL